MASQTVTFPCPSCGRRMGVPSELAGKKVRCPHCQQVVVSPANVAANPPPPPPSERPARAPATPPPPERELRPFNVPQKREAAESIMSEAAESEDDVFGSRPAPAPSLRPDDYTPKAPPPAAVSVPANPFEFTYASVNIGPAIAPAPAPQVAAKPQPAVARSAPAAPASENPFSEDEPEPAPAPAAAKKTAPIQEEELEEDDAPQEPPRKTKKRDAADPEAKKARGGSKAMLYVVLAWALIATAAAVYGLVFNTGPKLDTGHPLSTIPDNFGEFDPVSRKKVTKATFPVDGELPAAQRANLGGTIAIGQLEIQPKEIKKRRLVIEGHAAIGDEKRKDVTPNALVLKLAIKNVSPDLAIFPMDPAFTRKPTTEDKPITRVVVGKQMFSGGPIAWPLDKRYKKQIEVQQANDSVPLAPGELREYVVFTEPRSDIIKAVEASKDTVQWRVQVRRGLIDFGGKEVPVTAVVGVDFKASDIAPPD